MKINFGKETRDDLKRYGYIIDDIDWIGCEDFKISLTNFFDIADNFEYNNGYGCAYIPSDLVIVMKDGAWFERYEYDGSECWTLKTSPLKPTRMKILKGFFDDVYWPRLNDFCGRTNET